MRLSALAKQELQRLREADPCFYSALHNHERTRRRRDWRWASRARGEPPDAAAPPGTRPDVAALLGEGEERAARFREENGKLIGRYKRARKKREKRALAHELLRRLWDAGLITREQCIRLCALGPRSRKWWGPDAQVASATAGNATPYSNQGRPKEA